LNYWWVNQKQTHSQEIGDGYMWSPKRQQDGKPHFSYEYMKHIQPGDIIFSYANATILAIGVARTHCYSFPKPLEFSRVGFNWSNEGWKVDVNYRKVANPVRTMDYIQSLRHLLPGSKSPMQHATGKANQAYLFQIDKPLALALAHYIDAQTVDLVNGSFISENSEQSNTVDFHIENWENRIEEDILSSTEIPEIEKQTLVRARRGQGQFRDFLLAREKRCRITGVDRPEHLIASHIKPWRSADNQERLHPENGFMLTPSIDHLFDKGFISFEDNGSILLAGVADRDALERLGVIGKGAPTNIGSLSNGQKQFLDWHRDFILLS
jgi:hypothetical protein